MFCLEGFSRERVGGLVYSMQEEEEGGGIQRELFLIEVADRLKANWLWFCFAFGEGVGWWAGSVAHKISLSSTVGEGGEEGEVPWMPGFGGTSICTAARPMAGK